ncbi:MAG: hypothetical protein E6G62_01765 [Actinobacteria bacterium]|nr:MAG: hypothetical protein E6G62_01765 [Actinomycetota bacterium]
MSPRKTVGRSTLGAFMLVMAAMSLPVVSPAALTAPKPNKPRVSTGGVHRLGGSSAQLTGVVTPKGNPTSYYFQWGPTTAYGSQTPTASVPSTGVKVKVGQTITGLQQGITYHYRIVGVYTVAGLSQPPVLGRDRVLAITGQLKFELPKIGPIPVGSPFILSGALTGTGRANHPVQLEASTYPYTEPFAIIGTPAVTNSLGRFAFRIANFRTTTAFRVVAIEPRPIYSPSLTVSAAARVTLHVHTSAVKGIVRLYGTVTPAALGARLIIQFRKPIKLFFTTVKKGGVTFSRFSVIVKVRETGRYRAFVKLPRGPLVSGASSTVVLHAAPGTVRKSKAKH